MEDFFVESRETFSFKLDDFEGPLDLLLHLLKEAKIEIKNIFVSNITGQYLKYIEEMQTLDLEKASNFAGMAATLLDIKLRSVLPRTEEEDVVLEEDKNSIILLLEEYDLIKDSAIKLKATETTNRFYREPEFDEKDCRVLLTNFNLDNLLDAFAKIMHKAETKTVAAIPKVIVKDRFTVGQKTKSLAVALIEKKELTFFSLFDDDYTDSEKINTFLALLELLKKQFAEAIQEKPFEDIKIILKAGADGTDYLGGFDEQPDEYN
ncbi:MAG: segregation/condensation protein A [Clostridia bacterium]|nr:segregation/condensation protein A [Clostridia bacterium]